MPIKSEDVHVLLDRIKSSLDRAQRDDHPPSLKAIAQTYGNATEAVRGFAATPYAIAKLNEKGVFATIEPQVASIVSLGDNGDLIGVLRHSRTVLTTIALPGEPGGLPLHLPAIATTAISLDGDPAHVPDRDDADAEPAGDSVHLPDRDG